MATRAARLPNWVGAAAPLVLITVLAVIFVQVNPITSLRTPPPIEAVVVERTIFDEHATTVFPDGTRGTTGKNITLHVRNDGPDPVTIAQILVDDAYWAHTIDDRELGRLESTTIRIPYPWEEDLPLNIALVTATGVTIEHEIEAAAITPPIDDDTLIVYTLLGLYIGVIPVAVGLLWFGPLRRASDRWRAFFLAFTVGLLAFLLVDTIDHGFELAAETAAVLNGIGLFVIGAAVAVLVLTWLGGFMDRRRGMASGLVLAYLIAAGVGLHNLGEGLAVGAALAIGEVALGTFLVVGFALHNTTEGLAIVAPLGRESTRPPIGHLIALGAIAGVPTIFGAWAGGFAFAPATGALAFGLAAGAIGQVVWAIVRSLPRESGLASGTGTLGANAGLTVMYVTGLFTA